MRVRRVLPPAAAPIPARELAQAIIVLALRKDPRPGLLREISDHFSAKYAFLLSSGRAALWVALRALHRLSARREVVLPAYTCFSVPAAVLRAGLDVKLCDIDPSTLDFDYGHLRELLGPRTLCVVPTHLFGAVSDVARVRAMAEPHGAYVLEDASQTMGVSYRGQQLGTLGDLAVFSLGRGKPITCGEGGVVLTNHPTIGAAIADIHADLPEVSWLAEAKAWLEALLMTIFLRPRLYWIPASLPMLRLGETRFDPHFPVRRLPRTRAALLGRWRSRLVALNTARASRVSAYRTRLGANCLLEVAGPSLRFPVLLGSREERDALYQAGYRDGLGVSLAYPSALDRLPGLETAAGVHHGCPQAASIAERLVLFPTHELVSERDLSRICALATRVRDHALPSAEPLGAECRS